MSSKFFKGLNRSKKAQEASAPVEPRSMDEINKEYSELVGKAGIEQFKVHVHSKNLEGYNRRLLEVNQEANLRTELDKQQVKPEAQEEAKNE